VIFLGQCRFFPDLFEINHVQAAIFSPKIWGNIRKPLTMTSFETLELTSVDAHVLLVRLNRPEVSNAFNTQMAWDLINLFEGLALQPDDTRVVVDLFEINHVQAAIFSPKIWGNIRKPLTMTSFETLELTSVDAHVLLVRLNRPEAANAFNTQMAWDLINLFEGLALQPENTRVVVVTGAGEKAFCAGGDLKERNGMSDAAWQAQHLIYERMVRAVIACPLPTIGAINGAAFGGGCELAAAFDFIYASDSARFAQTEVRIGIIPGAGGTQTLARAIGERRAKELILSGRVFSAQEAYDWGLANAVCSAQSLLETALEMAKTIAGNAPIAVRQAKQAIHKGLQMGLMDGLAFEIEAYNRTIPTQDRREGVLAFNERRSPVFKGK
jgi:enoyl-CoA hydratase/carnithine racemase